MLPLSTQTTHLLFPQVIFLILSALPNMEDFLFQRKKMGWQLPSRVGFLTLVFSLLLCLMAANGQNASGVSVKLLDTPSKITQNTTAAFSFAWDRACGCSDSTIFICKLDDSVFSDCDIGKATYFDLDDGLHKFEVGINGSPKGLLDSASYNWTIDVAPPTAKVLASTPLTSDLNVSVNISFSKPCSFGGSFGCFAADSCNLKVQGPGEVIPSSLEVVVPNRKYKLLVSLASNVEYGQVNLSMGEGFCVDAAGRKFTPTPESTLLVKFDRRIYSSGLSSQIPAKRFEFNSRMVEVNATNNKDDLKFRLYFSQPVVNTSAQILNALNTSKGTLVEGDGRRLVNQTFFPFMVTNVSSRRTIITVSFESHSIITSQGIAVSPIAPFTFLYDVERPTVRLSTSTFRTREDNISISIHFIKPVVGFDSSNLSISGGHLLSFKNESWTAYTIKVQAVSDRISVHIPENVTVDLAGNQNRPSNLLVVRHDSTPAAAVAVSSFTTTSFVVMSAAAGLLAVSTANLQVRGDLPSSGLTLQPSSNLFTPNVYNELALSLQWSIPHYSLPWDGKHIPQSTEISKKLAKPIRFVRSKGGDSGEPPMANLPSLSYSIVDTILNWMDPDGNSKLAAAFRDEKTGWGKFAEGMLPLAYTTCSFLLLHCLLVLLLKLKRKEKSTEKPSNYGALTFPRIEIFLLLEAVAGVCQGSAALIYGGTPLGTAVGSILLVIVLEVQLVLLLFLLVGATYGKLLRYEEKVVLQESRQPSNCYQQLYRLIVGPGEKGEWTWKGETDSVYLIMFGLLFEDLRGGPPRLTPSQISGNNAGASSSGGEDLRGGPPRLTPSKISGNNAGASRRGGEDLRGGSPRLTPSQISGNNAGASRRGGVGIIILFKSATLKLLQSLSVYYTLTESIKRAFRRGGDGIIIPFKSATLKLLQSVSVYYTLIESIKRAWVGVLASNYLKNWHCRSPAITMLCINSFQLFFLVVGTPFIERRVQLVNIISVASEVGLYASGLARQKNDHKNDSKTGYLMLCLFLAGVLPLMANEVYGLYSEVKRLDRPDGRSFFKGLKVSMYGLRSFFTFSSSTPQLKAVGIEVRDPEKEAGPSSEGNSKSSFSKSKKTTGSSPLPLEASPSLEVASTQTQTREDAKSTSKDAEEIGSAPSSENNVEAQIEEV